MAKECKAGIYLRLSREDEAKNNESNSITSQRMITTDYAERWKIPIIKEYVDDGKSGANFDRPGFKAMIADIKADVINCVIIKDLSRFGRNLNEGGKYIQELFPIWGVRLCSILDGLDSSRGSDALEDTTVALKNLMHECYVKDTSVKIKSSFQTKMRRGEYIGSFAPYGYKRDPDRKGHLLIDESTSDIVRLIFRLTLDGMNPGAIAKYLNDCGTPVPEYGARIRKQGWKPYMIATILRNEVYIGNMVQGKTKKVSYKTKQIQYVDPKDWIRVPDTHEAIISRQTFDYVQDLLEMPSNAHDADGNVLLLSGFVRCGDCGQNLIRAKKQVYRCSTYARKDERHLCTPHINNEEKLERIISNAVRMEAAFLGSLLESMEESGSVPMRKERLDKVDAEIRKRIDEIAAQKETESCNYKNLMLNAMDPEDYAEDELRIERNIQRLEAEIEDLQKEKKALIEGISFFLPWLRSIRSLGRIGKLDRRTLTMLVHHIDVFENHRVWVHFRYEEDIAEMAGKELDIRHPVTEMTYECGEFRPRKVQTKEFFMGAKPENPVRVRA